MDRTIDAFRGTGYDGSTKLDIQAMKSGLTNASAARAGLDLVSNPAFVALAGKQHVEAEINDLKRAVYRACIAHGVPLPSRCVIDARMLGVQVV